MTFEFIAGDLALDLVGTVAERTTTQLERLTSPNDLMEWLVQAQVVDTVPAVTAADLTKARALREAIYHYLRALTDGGRLPKDPVAVINEFAAHPTPTLQLGATGRPVRAGTVGAALAEIARSAVRLAAPDQRSMVRWCADATCTRPFLDRSRGRQRRWCNMTGCGDRAKAAAYRRRKVTQN